MDNTINQSINHSATFFSLVDQFKSQGVILNPRFHNFQFLKCADVGDPFTQLINVPLKCPPCIAVPRSPYKKK